MDITTLPDQPDVNHSCSHGVFTAPVTEAEDAVLIAICRLAAEMDLANLTIAPLQDAVDTSTTSSNEWPLETN